ncbi:Hypothetical protein SMAX5B_020336 [Scophthalmus maximus]|uniref:Uncharacterized protein n=1 Tax=Scophthalmus maximus TaxID=52904 RepID=A0A2U9CMY1_SCOMX|nr:Hypothetical protein SMAX5B_020336 [Scophthalmus maximus]
MDTLRTFKGGSVAFTTHSHISAESSVSECCQYDFLSGTTKCGEVKMEELSPYKAPLYERVTNAEPDNGWIGGYAVCHRRKSASA